MADKDEKTKTPPASKRLEVKAVQLGGESFVDRLLPHVKKIAVGAGVIAAVVLIAVVIVWLKDRSKEKSTAKIVSVLAAGEVPIRPPGTPADPKVPSYANATERANALLDKMTKEGTDGGSPTYKASQLMQVGKYDEAAALYRKQQTAKGIDGVIAREGLGLALEQKATAEKDAATRQKGLEEALAVFQRMQPAEDGPRRAYALYHQGRVLALLGKTDEAKQTLEKAKTLGKDNRELADLVEERLASLGAT